MRLRKFLDIAPARLVGNRLYVIKSVIYGLRSQEMLEMKVDPGG
jgi:hypothetical protein